MGSLNGWDMNPGCDPSSSRPPASDDPEERTDRSVARRCDARPIRTRPRHRSIASDFDDRLRTDRRPCDSSLRRGANPHARHVIDRLRPHLDDPRGRAEVLRERDDVHAAGGAAAAAAAAVRRLAGRRRGGGGGGARDRARRRARGRRERRVKKLAVDRVVEAAAAPTSSTPQRRQRRRGSGGDGELLFVVNGGSLPSFRDTPHHIFALRAVSHLTSKFWMLAPWNE